MEVLLHFPFRNVDLSKAESKGIYDGIMTLAGRVTEQRRELKSVKSSGKDIFGEKSKELQAAIEKMKSEIDRLVFVLYGLTTKEIQQVESVVGGE